MKTPEVFKKRVRVILVLAGLLVFVLSIFSEENTGKSDINMPVHKSDKKRPQHAPTKRSVYPSGPTGDAKIWESGWSKPIKLGFNDEGWEDSPYITRDGKQILFFYHPYPNLANPKVAERVTEYVVYHSQEAIEKGIDGKIYFSNRPFNTKEIHPISKHKKYPSADTAPYLSVSGDLYCNSTKESFVQGKDIHVTVYKNGMRLDFGTGKEEANRLASVGRRRAELFQAKPRPERESYPFRQYSISEFLRVLAELEQQGRGNTFSKCRNRKMAVSFEQNSNLF